MRIAPVLAFGLALGLTLTAQDKAAKPEAPKTPTLDDMMAKPGPEMARLKPMVGTWDVEETIEASPMGPAGTGRGTGRVTLGPGGLSMMIDYQSKAGHMKGFHGNGVLAWDEPSKSYKQAWVDNMVAMMLVGKGRWEGETFIMETEGTMMGKPFKGKDVFSDIGKDGFILTSYMSMDGSPMAKVMTLKHRHAAKAAPKAGDKK
jgi:hypothetical protein